MAAAAYACGSGCRDTPEELAIRYGPMAKEMLADTGTFGPGGVDALRRAKDGFVIGTMFVRHDGGAIERVESRYG